MALAPKKFLLCFKAKLWRCTNLHLQLQNGFDHTMHTYDVELKCSNCEKIEKVEMQHCTSSQINPYVVEFQSGPKDEIILPEDSHANYQGLCSSCSSLLWVKMIPGYGEAYAPQDMYSMICDEEICGKMMMFEVYGGGPSGYTFGEGWQVEKKSGEIIEGIDLSGRFWAEEGSDQEIAANEESEEIEASDDSGTTSSGSEIVQGACIFGLSAFYKEWDA